ncbi:DUF6907 domain-containing protein [Streptomyces parvulus]|uniref:Uncharacterized protein n=1 Tax=Streptomyces parvulus TaxID=146923 RepID=A0A191UWX3_9ACTN|nr:hypothetical protein [Streptomyces parvulus]ANJ07165.1 hypothetical protein Spa2297_09195 [Streptomyces parvulus]GGR74262.1 hypothetical protein GCM10010220_28190 [Streptomyces parvulus]
MTTNHIPQQRTAATVHPFPAIKPGYRLAPAKIGTDDSAQIVYIECPNWCDEDHVADFVGAVEDVIHRTQATYEGAVIVPSFGVAPYPQQLFAYVEADPSDTNPLLKAAHVTVEDPRAATMAYLTPEMAEKLADEVIGFASHLRHLARTVRLANQGDSDPDMDEALRRVRGEAV